MGQQRPDAVPAERADGDRPAGGGAVFDVKVDDEGLPFVSHAFADVDLRRVGLLKVGSPKGAPTH